MIFFEKYGKKVAIFFAISLPVNLIPLVHEYFIAKPYSMLPLDLLMVVSFLILLVSPVILILSLLVSVFVSKQTREKTILVALCALVYLCAGVFINFGLRTYVRSYAFGKWTPKTIPLITAIKDYESDQGEPPDSLDDLVPRYLNEMPEIGMGRIVTPMVVYEKEPKRCDSWSISVPFDSDVYLVYSPSPDCPGFQGNKQKINDWVLYH